MRAIRSDIEKLDNPELYYKESSYRDGKGQVRACFEISIEGCERLSKRLTEPEKVEFMSKCRESVGEPVNEPESVEKEYTAKEVAEILGCSERTVRRRIQSGALRSEKREYRQVIVSERTVVTSEALKEFMEEQKEEVV
jgi:excisionase family DNA binding protein